MKPAYVLLIPKIKVVNNTVITVKLLTLMLILALMQLKGPLLILVYEVLQRILNIPVEPVAT